MILRSRDNGGNVKNFKGLDRSVKHFDAGDIHEICFSRIGMYSKERQITREEAVLLENYNGSGWKHETDGLPLCKPSDVKRLKTIGRGSYGHISLCQMQGKDYVLKELIVDDADSKKLFLKEARVMNNLNHQNIVKFNSIYKETEIGNHGINMEYLAFNFEPFGQEFVAHSLRDLLKFIDNYDCEGFEHLHQFVATDVCSGLSYLHDNNIVHRDLKPENILVSNQHYCKDNKDISTLWLNKPVVAKLTDFGESRAKLIQTATLVHTRTNNVFRGTPVFMASEIFFHDGTKLRDLQDLKQMDIWSYSMILFTFLNPDLKYPYHFEYCKEIESGNDRPATEVLKVLFGRRELPCNSTKYNRCATFGIRPEMRTIFSFLTKKPENRDGSRNLFTELNDLNEVDGAREFENAKNIHREHNEECVPKICSQDHSDNEVVDIEPTIEMTKMSKTDA
ncbi:unnamed protein product [Mytilus edulis]|uniref:Protein kinase domain-containing protein n=1 Tax=Mytilus edulis TaxID=6550 RepID=A0A8S3SJ70_MYTED|nr:unnamed protein product [Mytilus edulis]